MRKLLSVCSDCRKNVEKRCQVFKQLKDDGDWNCSGFTDNKNWEDDVNREVIAYAIKKNDLKYVPIGQERTVRELLSTL